MLNFIGLGVGDFEVEVDVGYCGVEDLVVVVDWIIVDDFDEKFGIVCVEELEEVILGDV